MMSRDTLIRSVAALAVFGCLAYFAFGVAAVVAAERPGTAIRHDDPITFNLLRQEISKISPEALVTWIRKGENGFWLRLFLSVAFTLAAIAFMFVIHPRILCSCHAAVIPGLGCGMGLLFVFGFFGLISFLFTLLNAFALDGLDGEWVVEVAPMLDAIGLLYVIANLLFVYALSFEASGRRQAAGPRVDGPAAA